MPPLPNTESWVFSERLITLLPSKNLCHCTEIRGYGRGQLGGGRASRSPASLLSLRSPLTEVTAAVALAWRDGGSEETSLPDFPVPTGKLGSYVRHGEVTRPLVPVLISECVTKEQSKI